MITKDISASINAKSIASGDSFDVPQTCGTPLQLAMVFKSSEDSYGAVINAAPTIGGTYAVLDPVFKVYNKNVVGIISQCGQLKANKDWIAVWGSEGGRSPSCYLPEVESLTVNIGGTVVLVFDEPVKETDIHSKSVSLRNIKDPANPVAMSISSTVLANTGMTYTITLDSAPVNGDVVEVLVTSGFFISTGKHVHNNEYRVSAGAK